MSRELFEVAKPTVRDYCLIQVPPDIAPYLLSVLVINIRVKPFYILYFLSVLSFFYQEIFNTSFAQT